MKCPICDHQNKKETFISGDGKHAKCPQCETDLETISLLSKMNDSKEITSLNTHVPSYGMWWNISKVVLIIILILIFGKALILFSNFLDKKEQATLHYQLLQNEIKIAKENAILEKKNSNEEFLKLKKEMTIKSEQYRKELQEIGKKLKIVQGQNKIYKNKKKLDSIGLVHYNGKDSLWKFSINIYGKGRFFPLLMHYNLKLKSNDNHAQYLKVLTNREESYRVYNEIMHFTKNKKAYYRYITKEGDTFFKIAKRFKGVIVGNKKTILKLNKKLRYIRDRITTGQKILLPFR